MSEPRNRHERRAAAKSAVATKAPEPMKPITLERLKEITGAKSRSEPPKAERGGFTGKLNIYVCESCREHIVTRDMDEGVTPFMILCEFCETGKMKSSFYRVFDQTMKEGYHWYKPGADELDTLKPGTRDHVERGGLLLRKADGSPTNSKNHTA